MLALCSQSCCLLLSFITSHPSSSPLSSRLPLPPIILSPISSRLSLPPPLSPHDLLIAPPLSSHLILPPSPLSSDLILPLSPHASTSPPPPIPFPNTRKRRLLCSPSRACLPQWPTPEMHSSDYSFNLTQLVDPPPPPPPHPNCSRIVRMSCFFMISKSPSVQIRKGPRYILGAPRCTVP